jgi:hypothetical protein
VKVWTKWRFETDSLIPDSSYFDNSVDGYHPFNLPKMKSIIPVLGFCYLIIFYMSCQQQTADNKEQAIDSSTKMIDLLKPHRENNMSFMQIN